MKQAKFILHNLSNQSYLQKLQELKYFDHVISLLPERLRDAIRFHYRKNETLFLVIDHPGYKMEVDYKIPLIKGLLKELKNMDENYKNITIKEIKTFVTHKKQLAPQLKPASFSGPFYKERSSGVFDNMAKENTLHEIFENIRKTICKNKQACINN